jgi:uncharacterized protein
MKGTFLRFYVHERDRHHDRPLWEWLLTQANELGIRGGSAFRAMAGFGRHHVLHEARLFKPAGNLTVEVEFIVSDDETSAMLALLRAEHVRLLYSRIPAKFGVINPDSDDPPLVTILD